MPPQQVMQREPGIAGASDVDAADVVVSRLLARVAELEGLLYQHDLHDGRNAGEGEIHLNVECFLCFTLGC